MRKVNQERFEERQRHIREAALACFRRSGFHQASMADICAEARMSAGNLYRYYDSKEAIIAAICEHNRAEVTQRFAAMRDRPDLFAAMLEVTGEAMDASAQLERSKFNCEVLAEAMRNERIAEIVRRHHAALLEMCAGALAHAQAMKLIDPKLDAKLAAMVLIAAGDGLGLKLALHHDFDPKQCIESFKLLVLRFLRPGA
jgi:TetR/AcrR family transcriptional regulator, repressor for uid operon